jgi:hypothetical protein
MDKYKFVYMILIFIAAIVTIIFFLINLSTYIELHDSNSLLWCIGYAIFFSVSIYMAFRLFKNKNNDI